VVVCPKKGKGLLKNEGNIEGKFVQDRPGRDRRKTPLIPTKAAIDRGGERVWTTGGKRGVKKKGQKKKRR